MYKNTANIVFIFEEIDNEIKSENSNYKWAINFLLILFFIFSYLENNFNLFIFNSLSIVGLYVSLELFINKLGKKSFIIKTLCSSKIRENLEVNNDCNKIFYSDKLNFFGFKLSDLSLIYFLTILVLGLLVNEISSLLKFISLLSVISIFYSLYIQLLIEKTLCKICLLIILVLSLQIIICSSFFDNSFNYNKIFASFLCFLTLFFIVKYINDTLKLKQKYYELSVKSIRFKKNYDIFKRELLLKHYKFKNRNEEFWIGNRNSNLHLSLITNPFCGYCKDAYLILIKILKNYPDVSIQLRFNYFSDNTDDNLTSIISIFKNIFINQGHELLFEAIEFWHDNNDIEILKKNYSSFAFETELDDVIKLAEENKIFALTQTPQILINNYLFPNLYEREDILYFIDDLIEDKEILNNYA